MGVTSFLRSTGAAEECFCRYCRVYRQPELRRGRDRHNDAENAAFAGLTLDFDPTAVCFSNLLGNRQADTCTAVRSTRLVRPVKMVEDVRDVKRLNADAVIT